MRAASSDGRGTRKRWAAAATLALVALMLAGPRTRVTDQWVAPNVGPDVDAYLAAREATVPDLRPGEQRSVRWADPEARARTGLALVYLHGFSADRHEVEPLVSDLGRALGANVYFARLRGHGRDGAAMAEASAEDWMADAAEAVAVGARIGERVVLIGTSTGGTLATWAATRPEARGSLAAMVLISPNYGLRDRASRFLLWPWGGLIARLAVGPERCFEAVSEQHALHWTTCYPAAALLPMVALTHHVRSLDLSGVTVPTLVVYSPDDLVVDATETERTVARMRFAPVETLVVRDAADPQGHVLAGDILSPATTSLVRERVVDFLEALQG